MTRIYLVTINADDGVMGLRHDRKIIATSKDRGHLLGEAARLLGGPVSETQDDADVLLTRQVCRHGAHADDDELRAEMARLRGGR